jgi:ribonuclease BN (tRNA processing enzyme)
VRGHLPPREAGELATAAGTRRLVLTHYGSETKPGDLAADAAAAFAGEITVADDHLRLALG